MNVELTLYRLLALWGACSLVFAVVWGVCGWLSRQAEKEGRR